MTDSVALQLALGIAGGLAAGFVAGLAFFGGLRLTVDRLAAARHPGALMLASLVVRMALAVAVLVALARWGGSAGLLGGAVGLLGARVLLVRRARAEVDAAPGRARR